MESMKEELNRLRAEVKAQKVKHHWKQGGEGRSSGGREGGRMLDSEDRMEGWWAE